MSTGGGTPDAVTLGSKAVFTPDRAAHAGSHQYVYHDDRVVLAVNVALVTGRPLLVTGAPGSGKSTLAADVARQLGYTSLARTITSRTRLEDLVARQDAVRRLADAQTGRLDDEPEAYLVPGVLWWALDPDSAGAVGSPVRDFTTEHEDTRPGCIVLLDEIDKAEPDLPNDLLGPLDRLVLDVPGRAEPVRAVRPVLVVLTSNEERALPPAFLRRCVALELDPPSPQVMAAIAMSHFGERERGDTLYLDVARRTLQLADLALREHLRSPSLAEYLDTVQACIAFDQRPPTDVQQGTSLWQGIEETALRKRRSRAPGRNEAASDETDV